MGSKISLMTDEERAESISYVVAAVELAGGQRALSRLICLSQPAISAWCAGKRQIPLARAIQIEKLLNREVRLTDMRPDMRKKSLMKNKEKVDSDDECDNLGLSLSN